MVVRDHGTILTDYPAEVDTVLVLFRAEILNEFETLWYMGGACASDAFSSKCEAHYEGNMFTGLFVCLVIHSAFMAEPLLKPGDVVFGDGGLDVIIRYDPQTQETNHIVPFDFADATGGIAVGNNGDIYAMRAKLGFGSYAEFYVFDGTTGAARLLSTERMIQSGRRMKIAPDGKSLYVAGEDQDDGRGVYQVDIATGHQTVVTTNLTNGPDYERPWDVAFDGQGGIYVTDFNYGNLLHFDAAGNRRVVTSDGMFDFIGGVDVDARGYVYVASRNYHGVVRVDPATGEQTSVTQNGYLRAPSDLSVAPDGSLLVADAAADVLVRVDPETGEQTILSQGSPGPRSPVVFAPRAESISLNASWSDGTVTLRWTDASSTWVLVERASFSEEWSASGLTPTTAGDEHSVAVTPTEAGRFFGLRRGP
jgi:hypothetical protein